MAPFTNYFIKLNCFVSYTVARSHEVFGLKFDTINTLYTVHFDSNDGHLHKLSKRQSRSTQSVGTVMILAGNTNIQLMSYFKPVFSWQPQACQSMRTLSPFHNSTYQELVNLRRHGKLSMFSHDVTAAILVSRNNETAAMLVSQTNPVGVETFSYANAFFCFNNFA